MEAYPCKTLQKTTTQTEYRLVADIKVVDPLSLSLSPSLSPGGIQPREHASMATALGPSTVQVPGAPVPAGDGGSERTPAGDQGGAGVQVRVGGCESVCVRGREKRGRWMCVYSLSFMYSTSVVLIVEFQNRLSHTLLLHLPPIHTLHFKYPTYTPFPQHSPIHVHCTCISPPHPLIFLSPFILHVMSSWTMSVKSFGSFF